MSRQKAHPPGAEGPHDLSPASEEPRSPRGVPRQTGHDERAGETLASTLIYEGRLISLRVDTIALPEGGTAVREVVNHPGAVVVAAVNEQGEVYLVRQFRHAVGRELLELPAGGLEMGEEPLSAAQRELREETGLLAEDWTSLGCFFSSPGFANEEIHAFLARGLTRAGADPDDDENLTVHRLPLEDLLSRAPGITDAKTLATLYLLRQGRAGVV